MTKVHPRAMSAGSWYPRDLPPPVCAQNGVICTA